MKLVLALMLMAGCTNPSTDATQTQAATPAGPRVVFPDGFVVKVEIAANDELRAQGLMYRDHLDPGAGMLFFFPEEGEYPFWMKNTRIPLDIIWIDADRRIVHVKHEVPPCRVADCPSYPPNARARYVLEVAGGEAKKHGLQAGHVLRFEGTESVVAE